MRKGRRRAVDLETIKRKVFAVADERYPRTIERLRELVRIPSVVGSEGEAQALVAQWYRDAGLAVETFEADRDAIAQHPAFVDAGFSYEGRPNVIGILAGEADARSLILNGHVDVVSAEPVAEWSRDPFGGVVEGDILYGRGAYDMKAGLVANLAALEAMMAAGWLPRGTVQLHSVVEEEAGGGAGTLATLLKGYRADGLLITEPGPQVAVASAGVMYFRVTAFGKTAHAGLAHLGVNAIDKMYKVFHALMELDRRRAERNRYRLFEETVGRSCHIVPGKLRAGDWPSTVAGSAVLECRMSFIPGESLAQVRREVEECIEAAAAEDDWLRSHPPRIEYFGWQAEPWEQDPNHPFVQTFQRAAEAVWERPIPVVGKAAGVDSRFARYFGMPALTFGPEGGRHHGVDEWVNLESVRRLTHTLIAFIIDWCGVRTG